MFAADMCARQAQMLAKKICKVMSRLDVRVDYLADDGYLAVVAQAERLAQEHGISSSTEGDWLRGKKGRTLYVGSENSERLRRIYEKGIQLGEDPDWTRLELQIRPQSHAKSWFAAMSPFQIIATDQFMRQLLDELHIDVAAGAVEGKPVRVRRDQDRARSALARQYCAHILKWVEDAGSPDEFVAEVVREHDLWEDQRRKSASAAARSPEGPSLLLLPKP